VQLSDETGTRLIGIVGVQPYESPPSVEFPSRHAKVAAYTRWISEVTGERRSKIFRNGQTNFSFLSLGQARNAQIC